MEASGRTRQIREATRTPSTTLKELKASVAQMGERRCVQKLQTGKQPIRTVPLNPRKGMWKTPRLVQNRFSFGALNGWHWHIVDQQRPEESWQECFKAIKWNVLEWPLQSPDVCSWTSKRLTPNPRATLWLHLINTEPKVAVWFFFTQYNLNELAIWHQKIANSHQETLNYTEHEYMLHVSCKCNKIGMSEQGECYLGIGSRVFCKCLRAI